VLKTTIASMMQARLRLRFPGRDPVPQPTRAKLTNAPSVIHVVLTSEPARAMIRSLMVM
jgi:hypothetical protein